MTYNTLVLDVYYQGALTWWKRHHCVISKIISSTDRIGSNSQPHMSSGHRCCSLSGLLVTLTKALTAIPSNREPDASIASGNIFQIDVNTIKRDPNYIPKVFAGSHKEKTKVCRVVHRLFRSVVLAAIRNRDVSSARRRRGGAHKTFSVHISTHKM